MASRDIEFKVGAVILIGLVILAGSIFWLQQYHLTNNAILLKVHFDDVGTLAIGDKVTVSGVHKGKVNKMRLEPGGVEVDLIISSDVQLKSDAQIVIKNFGVMGERFVSIAPGQDSLDLDITQPINGQYDAGLPEVMGLMGEMVVELRELVGTMKKTAVSDSSLHKFSRTIANLESVSTSLDSYMKRNEGKLDQTADNFLNASKQLNNTLTENAHHVDSIANRVDRVSLELEKFVQQLDTLSSAAREFAESINNPEGSLKLLMDDRRLYDDLRQTADNIDDLVTDIRNDPKKFLTVKVSVF
jgi:phospholipid/cholesterol/gamma-HCH transport system substrate-binding protein